MNPAFSSRLERIESVLRQVLPAKVGETWKTLSFASLNPCVSDSHFSGLLDPCVALVALGGKRWRPLLLVLCAELAAAAKGSGSRAVENAYSLTPLVEFAHTASLIHDDIEDAADMRRGKPAAHITYGIDVAINAGSWLYFEAPACIDAAGLPEDKKNLFYSLYLLELRRLHLGQAMDILWHRNGTLIPTQAEYMAMVRNKTGTLARMAVKIGMCCGGATPEETERAGKIAEDIGVGFQILDDTTNITTGNVGKKRGDDIVEGKKSLPVLMHLESVPQDADRLSALFAQARREGIDSPAVEQVIGMLEDSGAVEAARLSGLELVTKKSRELACFFGKDFEATLLIEELFSSMQHKA